MCGFLNQGVGIVNNFVFREIHLYKRGLRDKLHMFVTPLFLESSLPAAVHKLFCCCWFCCLQQQDEQQQNRKAAIGGQDTSIVTGFLFWRSLLYQNGSVCQAIHSDFLPI